MDTGLPHIFFNADGRLRSGWWIAIFLCVLAAAIVPLTIQAQESNTQVPLWQQLVAVAAASILCQALRRRQLSELFGAANAASVLAFGRGVIAGAVLMAAPACLLAISGAVTWSASPAGAPPIVPVLGVLALAAAIEELTFRGFLFQRLLDGLGEWPAQLIVAAMFVLTHSGMLAAHGILGVLAGANIFLASILFGLAYLRTRGLAMPFGLHLAANVTQGPVLGFGVSGDTQQGLLTPTFEGAPEWLTGGSFGLEASVPGLIGLSALTFVLWRWRAKLR